MKLIKSFFLCTLAVIAAVSCNKEKEVPEGSPVDLVYKASYALDGFSWEKGDMFSLLDGNNNFGFRTSGSGARAEFSGTAVKYPEGASLIAVTPYSEDYVLDGRNFQAVVPASVTAYPGVKEGGIAVGIPDGDEIVFKHVNAFLEVELTRGDVRGLVLRGGNDENLAGTYRVNVASSGAATMTLTGEGSSSLAVVGELTPGKYYIPVPPQGYNGFRFSVKTTSGFGDCVIENYPRLQPGTIYSVGKVDENLDIHSMTLPLVELHAATSSTIAVTWSISDFLDIPTDITEDWSVGIYNDAACSDLRVSWNIPAAAWTSLNGNTAASIGGPYSPRFEFSGLPQQTDFWVKVWYTDRPDYASAPLKVTTLSYENKQLPSATAAEGDLLLSEDFGELLWGGDIATRSYGYSDENRSSVTALHSAEGENPVGEYTIDGVKHKFYLVNPTIEIGLFNTLGKTLSATRLADWTSISEDNSDGKLLARPGYVKLGASSKTGGIVTPPLNCLENKALVTVKFKAHPYKESSVDPLDGSVFAVTSDETGVSVLKDYVLGKKADFTISSDELWKEYSLDVVVKPGDRVAISSRRASGTGQCRFLVDEMSLTLKQYINDTKVYTIATAQDLVDFLSVAGDYTPEDDPVVFTADIDLTGVSLPEGGTFLGTLDGQGHKISKWNNEEKALFATLGKDSEGEIGVVKNLIIDASCTLTPALDGNFGFIADTIESSGVIDAVTTNAPVALEVASIASPRVGMLAGVSYGLIRNCTNNGNFSLTTSAASGNLYLGGLVGYINSGDRAGLSNNVNNGDISYRVNAKGAYVFIGGIAAGTSTRKISEATSSRGHIEQCLNTGNITYVSTNGGSLADNEGTPGTGNYIKVGGVVGYFEGSMTGCTNGVAGDASKGKVTVTIPTSASGACATGSSIGGVAAFVMRDVEGCVNFGKVTVKGTFAGGTADIQGGGVKTDFCAGGIVAQCGPASGGDSYSVSGCHNYGELDINSWMATGNSSGMYFGGIAGWLGLRASECVNEGKIGISSKAASNYVGGVFGQSAFAATGVVNHGEVNVTLLRDNTASDNKQSAGTYHRIGGVVGYSAAGLSSSSNDGKIVVVGSSNQGVFCPLVGGVSGQASGSFDACVNTGEISVTHPADGTNGLRVGGLIGHCGGLPFSGECYNTGAITVTGGTFSTGTLLVGGAVAYMESGATTTTPIESRDATKPVTVTVAHMEKQPYIAGVIAYINGTTAKTRSALKNWKPLIVDFGSTTSATAYAYVAGVSATANTNQTFSACENYGDISVISPFKTRLAGISSYTNKPTENCKADCDITAKLCEKDFSEVGGIVSYTAATGFTGNSFTGKIDVSSSSSKVYTGGILGKSNGNSVFEGCSFSGDISGSVNNPGLYVGGLQADNLAFTFGGAELETRCVVGSGSKLNGTVVTADDMDNTHLVSQSSDNGEFSSTSTIIYIAVL